MTLLTNGYFQDGLKALVYFIPLLYLFLNKNRLGLKFFNLFAIGLFLLFFGHLVDFLDEFEFLRNAFPEKNYKLLQDFLEDVVGMTFGFAFLISALYLEFKKYIVKNS